MGRVVSDGHYIHCILASPKVCTPPCPAAITTPIAPPFSQPLCCSCFPALTFLLARLPPPLLPAACCPACGCMQIMVDKEVGDQVGGLKQLTPTSTCVLIEGVLAETPEGTKQKVGGQWAAVGGSGRQWAAVAASAGAAWGWQLAGCWWAGSLLLSVCHCPGAWLRGAVLACLPACLPAPRGQQPACMHASACACACIIPKAESGG